MERNWKTIIIILTLIWLFSTIISSSTKISGSEANIAVIRIYGPIGEKSGLSSGVSANTVIDELDKAEEMPNIKYILIDINSPGGMPVDSERIFKKISSIKKPTVAVIEDSATSGAYWIACGADKIFASNISIVGSVGVLGSFLSFEGLMNKYGVRYNKMTAGKFKDIGSPFRNMTNEEKSIYKERLKIMDKYFINSVAEKRNLTENEKENISSALFYTGGQALKLHLVDYMGTYEDALKFIGKKMNETPRTYVFKTKKSFIERLSEMSMKDSFLIGLGIGDSLKTEKTNFISLS